MKKIFFTLLVSCLFIFASAKVITINNNPNSPSKYTNLQTAIDSASSGDTIYIQGSTINYGNVTIKKRLNLFGTGNNPNKSNKLVSALGSLQFDTVQGISGASGSKIIGFNLNSIFGYGGSIGTNNILIARNYFNSGSTFIKITGMSWTVENNIFSSGLVNLNNSSNTIIRNNIFNGSNLFNSNQPTVVISNNLFLGNSQTTALSTISDCLISNNIFSGSSPVEVGVTNNIFSNNITYQTSSTIPFGTNTGSGNLVAQNPKFVNAPTNVFYYYYDFALAPSSPGKNAGTDGKDIGIYGGARPFVDLTGTPSVPQVKSISILNPVLSLGGGLRVTVKAKKQN